MIPPVRSGLTCPQHPPQPLTLLCMQPFCLSECILCPSCQADRHSRHQVMTFIDFRRTQLKKLSLNCRRKDNSFLQALKQKLVREMEAKMEDTIATVREAIEYQYGTIVDTYSPFTEINQREKLEDLQDPKQYMDALLRIKIIDKNQFKFITGNVDKIEQKFREKLIAASRKCQQAQQLLQQLPYMRPYDSVGGWQSRFEYDLGFEEQKMEAEGPDSLVSHAQIQKYIEKSKKAPTAELDIISVGSSSSAGLPTRSRSKALRKMPVLKVDNTRSRLGREVKRPKKYTLENLFRKQAGKSVSEQKKPFVIEENKREGQTPETTEALTRSRRPREDLQELKKSIRADIRQYEREGNEEAMGKKSVTETREKQATIQTKLMLSKAGKHPTFQPEPQLEPEPSPNSRPSPPAVSACSTPAPYLIHGSLRRPPQHPCTLTPPQLHSWLLSAYPGSQVPYSMVLSHRGSGQSTQYLLFCGGQLGWFSKEYMRLVDEMDNVRMYYQSLVMYE